jgi:hypothetical protein
VRQGERGREGRERHLPTIDKRERDRDREKDRQAEVRLGERGRERRLPTINKRERREGQAVRPRCEAGNGSDTYLLVIRDR